MNTEDIVKTWRREVEDTHDEPTLRVWLKLAGTRGADEIAAAIHASRAN